MRSGGPTCGHLRSPDPSSCEAPGMSPEARLSIERRSDDAEPQSRFVMAVRQATPPQANVFNQLMGL